MLRLLKNPAVINSLLTLAEDLNVFSVEFFCVYCEATPSYSDTSYAIVLDSPVVRSFKHVKQSRVRGAVEDGIH